MPFFLHPWKYMRMQMIVTGLLWIPWTCSHLLSGKLFAYSSTLLLVASYFQHMSKQIDTALELPHWSGESALGLGLLLCHTDEMLSHLCCVVYGDSKDCPETYTFPPVYLSEHRWSITSICLMSEGVHFFSTCSTCAVWAYISYCLLYPALCSFVHMSVSPFHCGSSSGTHPYLSLCHPCLTLCPA